MTTRAKLYKLIQRTESELQALISEAALEKDYDLIGEIANLAKLLDTGKPPGNVDTPKPLKRSSETSPQPTKKIPNSSSAKAYPQFAVRGQDLLKTGWSKKARKEYSQKTSREVLNALVERIKAYSEEEIFAIEDVLPGLVDGSGEALPSYQVYIALGFMKKYELVQQHGRQGYSICFENEFAGQVEKQWNLLKKNK